MQLSNVWSRDTFMHTSSGECWLSPLRQRGTWREEKKKKNMFIPFQAQIFSIPVWSWGGEELLCWMTESVSVQGLGELPTGGPSLLPLLHLQALAIYLHLTHGPLKLDQRKHGWCHYLCTTAGGEVGCWCTGKKQHTCAEVINEVLCKAPFLKREMRWVGRQNRKLFNRPILALPHPIGHAVYFCAFHRATMPWVAPSTRQNATFSSLNMLSRLACLPPKWGGCSNVLQLWHFFLFLRHSVVASITGNCHFFLLLHEMKIKSI